MTVSDDKSRPLFDADRSIFTIFKNTKISLFEVVVNINIALTTLTIRKDCLKMRTLRKS